MIEQIEKFSSEIQIGALTECQGESLDDCALSVHKARSIGRCARSIPEFSGRGIRETLCVKPFIQGLVIGLGTAGLIGAHKVVPIVRQVYAGTVVAGDDEYRKSRGELFDHIDLPISKDRIDRPAPAAAELFAFAKGKVIEHAGSEVVVELDLRQAPVCSRRSRQGPVGHASAGTQSVVESRVEIARVRVPQKDIESVPGALGFRLHLERIIPSRTGVGGGSDGGEWAERGRGNSTAKRVTRHNAACGGRGHVQVAAVHQNVMTASARIPHCQHNTAGQLLFNVEVELLNSALFEIKILRLNSSRERGRVWLLSKNRGKTIRHIQAKVERSNRTGAGRSRGGTASDGKRERVRFREERRVLPQTLPSLVPGGIVEDRIASTHRRFGAPERLPRQSNAGF